MLELTQLNKNYFNHQFLKFRTQYYLNETKELIARHKLLTAFIICLLAPGVKNIQAMGIPFYALIDPSITLKAKLIYLVILLFFLLSLTKAQFSFIKGGAFREYLHTLSIPSFLNHKKIIVFTSQEYGDIGDIGKFYQIEQQNGYILTIDDDLIYPPDYVDSMVRKIDLYQRKALICVHGNILPKQKLISYYKDKQGVHFEKELENDIEVDVPGTGTLGFHTDNIQISQQEFLSPNMTDIWLAVHAKQNNIPIISVERSNNWVIQVRGEAFQKSIYRTSFQKDTYQNSVVNNVFFIE